MYGNIFGDIKNCSSTLGRCQWQQPHTKRDLSESRLISPMSKLKDFCKHVPVTSSRPHFPATLAVKTQLWSITTPCNIAFWLSFIFPMLQGLSMVAALKAEHCLTRWKHREEFGHDQGSLDLRERSLCICRQFHNNCLLYFQPKKDKNKISDHTNIFGNVTLLERREILINNNII